jgi:paraquat-inducible protein A
MECDQDGFVKASACTRCGRRFHSSRFKSLHLVLAFSITALAFYIPAMSFPFMSVELYGSRQVSTIWQGVVSLADAGSWPIAIIVFMASIVIPVLKLGALIYIAIAPRLTGSSYMKTQIFRTVEYIGRWSMLDIFLLAVLVALIKLGPWASVEPRLGALLFALVVVFTMLASASFDPRLLWKDHHDRKRP